MGRLIDADELQKQGWCLVRDSKATNGYIREFKSLDKIPTAYNVDEVVRQIREAVDEDNMVCSINNKPVIYKEQAIEILKAGGIDRLTTNKDISEMAAETTKIDEIIKKMGKWICDEICVHAKECSDQDKLDNYCCECNLGQYACEILNKHNHIGDFEQMATKTKK